MVCPSLVLLGESMATFRKRSNGWQVRIQRKGYPDQTKTFVTRNAAAEWARLIESELDRGVFINRTQAENTTLGELLQRYLLEITPHKKGAAVERYRINAWLSHPLSARFLSTLRSIDLANWRDSRIKLGRSPNTIKLELAVLSHMFNVAIHEWGFESLTNIAELVRIPKLPNGRTRRVSDEDLNRLLSFSSSYELPYIARLAIETGMRRSEISSLNYTNINFTDRTARLLDTKNGEERLVPLSSICIVIIKNLPRRVDGKIFGITPHAISYAFIRACKRAKLNDLHFHDLRHEAISRLFEKGFSLAEVATISGHKTWSMLKRYTHLKAEDLAKKLG